MQVSSIMNWYSLEIEKAFELTRSSVTGITNEEVEERLLIHGRNELAEKKKRPPWLLFINQFSDFMILVLIAAAVK